MKVKISPMILQRAKTLALINGTTVIHQLKLQARRTARLNSKPKYEGSVKRAESYVIY